MDTYISTRGFIRCSQLLLSFLFVSICLFLLSIVTFLTLRKHLIPISHLVIPMPLGFPSSFNPNNHSTKLPSYLVSTIDLNDPMYERSPLDISHHSYRIELVCYSPRSYINRQVGSFFVQLLLYSTSNQLILDHSRLVLFPYESQIVHVIRTLILLPLSIFHIDYDQWEIQQILIERLKHPKSAIQVIQLNILPSAFQLHQCSLHLHILDLTGFVYLFLSYPIITGCLSIFVLFSIYLTFYLIITALTMLNQTTKSSKEE